MLSSRAADVDALWADLVAAALLGTERQPPPLAPTGGALDAVLAALGPAAPPAQLLGAAGAVAAYRRAGRRHAVAAAPPEPAPADPRPPCSPSADVRLAAMLAGDHADLLGEWLAAVATAGRRVAPSRLPDLLDLAARRADLRPAVLAAAGPRGAWLAGQNPTWASLVAGDDADDDEALWQSGDRQARVALLARLRARDPAAARRLLESTWAEEPPDARAAFVGTLALGLSMADEPFLEAGLDDRRKEVRDAAVALLLRLSDSRLVRRMAERVVPSLRFSRGLRLLPGFGVPRLDVDPPAAHDRAMGRDGVEAKAPHGQPLGDRAWWLRRLLAAVPPSACSAALGAAPSDLIDAAVKSDWALALLAGWGDAAVNHRDADWAEALLAAPHVPDETVAGLVELLPPERREALAERLLRAERGALRGDHPAMPVLRHCQHSWGDALARAVLARLREGIAGRDQRFGSDWPAQAALATFARRIPPTLADEAADGWPTGARFWQWWSRPVEGMAATLRFRRDMLEEITR
jgi:hypothetical protein